MTFTRQTVSDAVSFTGLGLHSGENVTVTVNPGKKGIAFRGPSGKRIAATPKNVSDTTRCTRLGEISTVEHLMSAFAGIGITDAEVELTANELPALDGSADEYFSGLRITGLAELGPVEVDGPFARIYSKANGIEIAIAKGTGWWRCVFDAGERFPGRQEVEVEINPSSYFSYVAQARTFAFEEEVEPLRKAGLGKGLHEENVLILGQTGPLNRQKIREEPARHKLLDLIGDLYLAGIPPMLLDVVGIRCGHHSNVAAAQKLAENIKISPF